jgi:hypothetical protein
MRDRPVADISTLQQHTTHKRQTSMLLPVFEPATPASHRLEAHALDRATTVIGQKFLSAV